MKLLVASCLLLIIINPAYSLKCWMCMGSMQSDCFRGEEISMTIQDCDNQGTKKAPLTENDVAIVQRCVSFVNIISGSEVITRGCGWIYENVDICEYMEGVTPQLISCSSCNDNLCNA